MAGNLGLLRFLLLSARSQLVACPPERREEVVVDHLPQHFDRRSLRADDLVADDPRHHLVVTDAPRRDALVPVDQRLRKLIQLFVLASANVYLDDVEARFPERSVEGLAEWRRHASSLA